MSFINDGWKKKPKAVLTTKKANLTTAAPEVWSNITSDWTYANFDPDFYIFDSKTRAYEKEGKKEEYTILKGLRKGEEEVYN